MTSHPVSSSKYNFQEILKMPNFKNLFIPAYAILLFFITITFYQLLNGNTVGDRPAPTSFLLIFTSCYALFLFILFNLRSVSITVKSGVLNVKLQPSGISIYTVKTEDIREVQVIPVNPVLDYGGWGLRYSTTRGWAIVGESVQGDLIYFIDGKKFLITTEDPIALKEALKTSTK